MAKPDPRINTIKSAILDLFADKKYSIEQAIENMTEIEVHVKELIDGLKDDLSNQDKKGAKK